ncbi:phage tail protein [Escherichia coli]|nr:phage tail protein [Escherichia coli]MDY9482665.1 phage tail protein [Escherichia coli]
MALPRKLKHLNLFNDGNNWQGIVESLTLPKFTRKYEKYRGGGMPGAVDVDQELQYQRSWRHAANSRVNRRPSTQFLGPENDMLTLSGVLMPEITGGRLSLLALEQMAEQGKAWPLIEGSGTIYGMYVIEGLNQTKTEFFRDGMPRRIEFTLSLKRVDESLSDMFGDLSAQLNNLQETATSALSDISKTVGGLLS